MQKNKKKLWIGLGIAVLLAAALAVTVIVSLNQATAGEISKEQAQQVVEQKLDAVLTGTKSLTCLKERSSLTVLSMEYGVERDVILTCSYQTVDVYSALKESVDFLLGLNTTTPNGMQMSATAIRLEIDGDLQELIASAAPLSGTVQIAIYDIDGTYQVYLDDAVIDAVYGGILKAKDEVLALKSITVDGQQVSIETKTNLRNGLVQCIALSVEDREKPDTSHPIIRIWNDFADEFVRNFGNGYWRYLLNGLLTTLQITFFALLIGLVIGFIVAIVRCTHDKTGKLGILNWFFTLYLTVVRGTPVMVQLLIIYFVLLLPIGVDKVSAAVFCFGFNSGAYVAEIVRGGIMGVDDGQMEAGRSLGFNYAQTMWYIVIPQAFKSVLPALANEFIALLKETSVASYIGVSDLTRGGEIIRSITFSNFMPLVAVALIYLVLVLGLSELVKLLERRLRKGDRG